MVANQRRRAGYSPFEFTAKTLLTILAFGAMLCSAAFWWGIQSTLTDNHVIAAAFTALLVLAPPSLVSFLIPWSPAGMLLQKVNARTWAFPVIIGSSLYLIYYAFQLMTAWWAAQPVVADSGLIVQQTLIGLIGFIIVPALMWTPVSSDELVEQVRQAHLVKRYELQTQADIAILRATLLRAQEKALIGFANLAVGEREELAAVMDSLVTGIDQTLKEVGQTVKSVSGVSLPFDSMLDDNEDIRDILDYIGDSLVTNTMTYQEESGEEYVTTTPNRANVPNHAAGRRPILREEETEPGRNQRVAHERRTTRVADEINRPSDQALGRNEQNRWVAFRAGDRQVKARVVGWDANNPVVENRNGVRKTIPWNSVVDDWNE